MIFAVLFAWTAFATVPAAPEFPEDLGPATIDVSSYPMDQQETYRKIFLPVYSFLRGGPARGINSPLIELDKSTEDALRKEHPELLGDPELATVGRDVWRREVMRIKTRPPCCGACPVLSMEDARRLWKFMAYDSLRRKTGANTGLWIEHRRKLIAAFKKISNDPSGSGRHRP